MTSLSLTSHLLPSLFVTCSLVCLRCVVFRRSRVRHMWTYVAVWWGRIWAGWLLSHVYTRAYVVGEDLGSAPPTLLPYCLQVSCPSASTVLPECVASRLALRWGALKRPDVHWPLVLVHQLWSPPPLNSHSPKWPLLLSH
jgi:hypothetical protein